MADVLTDATTRRAFLLDKTQEYVRPIIDITAPFFAEIKRDSKGVKSDGPGAYYIYLPVGKSLPQGIGAGGSLAAAVSYADASAVTADRARFELMLHHEKIALLQQIMAQAESNPKAVVPYLTNEMKSAMLSMALDGDRILHMGANGKLCETTSVDAGGSGSVNSFTIDNYHIVDTMINAKVDIRNQDASATQRNGSDVTITAINRDTRTMTVALGGADNDIDDVASGDWLLRKSATVTSGAPANQYGVRDAISNADVDLVDSDADYAFGNISRATAANAFWQGNYYDHSSAVYDHTVLQRIYDEALTRCGERINRMYMPIEIRNAFVSAWRDDHTIMPDTMDLKAGFTAIKYTATGTEVGLVTDKRVPYNSSTAVGEIWGVTLDSLGFKQTEGPHWDRDAGQTLYKDQSQTVLYAYIHWIWQLVCGNPGANCLCVNVRGEGGA